MTQARSEYFASATQLLIHPGCLTANEDRWLLGLLKHALKLDALGQFAIGWKLYRMGYTSQNAVLCEFTTEHKRKLSRVQR